MDLGLFIWIVDISTGLTAIALILCLYKFRSRSAEVKFQAISFMISVVIMLIIKFWKIRGPVINIPQNLYIVPNVLLILLMYDAAWKGRYRVLSIISAVLFCLFSIWNVLYGQQANFNSYSIALGSVFVIIHSVLYYYYLLVNLPVQKLSRLPMFWFNAGYLIYFAGSLFIFAAYVIEVFYDSLLLYWTIQNLLRIVQFILIIVGLCQDLRNIRLSSSLPSAR